MSKIRDFIWLIPLIGGVISLIGFLFPAWYSPPTWIEYVWIVGIIHHVTAGNIFEITPSIMLIPSLVTTVLISLSSIMIILNTLFKLRGKKLLGNTENLWITMAILELASSIYYIFGIQIAFFEHTGLNFWDFYEIQFGMFVPFIGVGLTLIGAITGKIFKRELIKT